MQPHIQTTLDVIREADGRIRFEDVCLRVRRKMFPGSARTAGVFTAVEKAIQDLIGLGFVDSDTPKVYFVTAKGREAQ